MADNSSDSGSNVKSARETIEVLMEMSSLLNTGLDSETLVLCVKLCEAGVNPEALASVIRELRRESSAIKSSEQSK